jgi:hypothetical protein
VPERIDEVALPILVFTSSGVRWFSWNRLLSKEAVQVADNAPGLPIAALDHSLPDVDVTLADRGMVWTRLGAGGIIM